MREASFLCNPRTPPSVLRSSVTADAKISKSVSADGSNAAEARIEGLALVDTLKQHADKKVLRLSTPPPDYRALLPSSEVDSFENTMKGYASLWCCNRPPGGRGAGHIWYDFLSDVIPHKDRFNRRWSEAWIPKMGP